MFLSLIVLVTQNTQLVIECGLDIKTERREIVLQEKALDIVYSKQTAYIVARYWKDGSEILIDQSDKGLNPRRLTPVEAGRLQGYNIEGAGWQNPEKSLNTPDNIPFKIVVSSKEAYRQFGNSVAVPVVKRLALEIVKQLLS